MDLERAEAPAELDVIRGREPLLVAEDEDGMLLEGAADAEEIRFRQGLGKIEADDLGAQHGRQLPYREIHRRSSSGGAGPATLRAAALASRCCSGRAAPLGSGAQDAPDLIDQFC